MGAVISYRRATSETSHFLIMCPAGEFVGRVTHWPDHNPLIFAKDAWGWTSSYTVVSARTVASHYHHLNIVDLDLTRSKL